MRGRDRPPAGCDRLANRAAQASGSRRRPAMAWSSSNTRHDDRHGGLAKDSFAVMAAVHAGPDSRWTRYPARAPRERGCLREEAKSYGKGLHVERGLAPGHRYFPVSVPSVWAGADDVVSHGAVGALCGFGNGRRRK